jgi:hypothetical protein
MMANSLIDATIREIAQAYQPGALAWMKTNRPDEWGNMLTLERRVNETALGGHLKRLREVLSEYQGIILTMVEEFRSQPNHGRQGTFAFEEMG